MPSDEQSPESIPDPSNLADEDSTAPPQVVESADFAFPSEIPAAPPSLRDPGEDLATDAPSIRSDALGESDNPVLRAYELDVHTTIVELRRIEADVRALLQDRDPIRKRRLTGTARWQELEDDLIRWRFTGRFEEDVLRRAQELVGRRHYLFRHLRYLSSTRPVWNS